MVVVLELVFGFDEHSFGLGNSGHDSVRELVHRFHSQAQPIWLEPHPRVMTGVCH
jgi:hypothetical protein